jgi:hypothetical protein
MYKITRLSILILFGNLILGTVSLSGFRWPGTAVWHSRRQPMVREKMLVVRGEIWTFAIFMFMFYYILIRLRVTDTGSLTIFALLRCIKFTFLERESINLFQTSSNECHTNNFVIIKQVHFILIKWNFYYHYFIDVCTFLKNSC